MHSAHNNNSVHVVCVCREKIVGGGGGGEGLTSVKMEIARQ